MRVSSLSGIVGTLWLINFGASCVQVTGLRRFFCFHSSWESAVILNIRSAMGPVVLGCGLMLMVGCGGGSAAYTGPAQAAVKGKVTFGGEPVENGSISFIPSNDKSRKAGAQIVKGEYNIPEAGGPNLGSYAVQIHWAKPTGKKYVEPDSGSELDELKEVIPDKYHDKTELTIDIKAGVNEKNWELTP